MEITPGASSYQIGYMLKDKGLIKNPLFFRVYAKMSGHAASIKAGSYLVEQGRSIPEILDMISNGKVRADVQRFTIPEGFTIEQIADTLEKNGIANKQRFLQEADNGDFEYDFVKEIPKKDGMKHRLEGYLFPETYEVKKGASEREIIDVMLKQFSLVMTPEFREQLKAQGLSSHEAVTLASLVEREAQVPKERPTIAGVMYNRLRLNPPMPLQIDATIQYVVGQKPELLLKDLEVESPYNTYKHLGMPPGPIASPGLDSLKAVAQPEKHEYLYYVTKKDGSGEHYFAKTLDEHNQNIARSEHK